MQKKWKLGVEYFGLTSDGIAVLEEDQDNVPEEDPEYGYEGEDFYRFRNLRLNHYAVKALQARVNLYAGNTVEANTAANYVIDEASKYFPWINASNIVGSNPDRIFYPEILFGIQNRGINDRHKDYYVSDLDVKSILNGLTIQWEGDEKADTLKTYIGNNTWADDNTRIIIINNEYRFVKPRAYYILKKEIE